MLASLPMYDLPEVQDATDDLWKALAQNLGVDLGLSRGPDWSAPWRRPDLIFSQTCGYPLTHDFKDVLHYVATPHYAADGCEGPYYRSILFAREKSALSAFQGKTAAYNSRDSMSGMLALKYVFAPLSVGGEFFKGGVETGGHLSSLSAVQKGLADICAIDCVTVAYAKRYRPQVFNGLVEVARSPLVPGLPYVTRAGGVDDVRRAVSATLQSPETAVTRQKLLLTGHSVLRIDDYAIILQMEKEVEAQGGLKLW